jgi:hypothetical protein
VVVGIVALAAGFMNALAWSDDPLGAARQAVIGSLLLALTAHRPPAICPV